MKKEKSRKIEKKPVSAEPVLKAGNRTPEEDGRSILDLAASFWDAGRDYPSERRA